MNLIALADKNWGIGYRGKQPVSIPSDRKYFRELTAGKVLVMGRRTLESLPNGRAPSGRSSIVLSRRSGYRAGGAKTADSVDAALALLKGYADEDIYVIGGASIYKAFLPCCDTAYITKVDTAFEADAYMPDLDADEEWEITADGGEQTYFNLEFHCLIYERV